MGREMNRARITICLLLFLGACQGQSQKDANVESLEIAFLTREGCPRSPAVYDILKAVLAEQGVAEEPVTIDLGELAEDDYLTGYGTPTILVRGIDLFGSDVPKPATPT